jgi:hypothetical protein
LNLSLNPRGVNRYTLVGQEAAHIREQKKMQVMMVRTQVEEQEIEGPTTVECRHEEKLPEEREHLSPINWLHGVIRILRVLRYKVIFRSKSFFNTFGS